MFPRRAAALLLVFGLAAGACSSEEPATDDPALTDLLAPDDPSSASGSGDDSTTTLLPPTPTDPPAIEGPMFAGRPVACGGEATRVALATVGVDDATIAIGTGNDRGGFFAGGAGRAMPDAVTAMVGLCNELGGLNGRTLVVRDYDAAVVEVAGRAMQQCDEVAAMVGYGFLDELAAIETWTSCGLPLFPGWDAAVLDPPLLAAHGIAALADPAARVVALLGPRTASGDARRIGAADALVAAGFDVVLDESYSVTTATDWDAVAAAVAAAGVGLVHLDGGCEGALVPLLDAIASQEVAPFVIAGPQAYDPACIAAAAVSFERVMLELPFLPLEDGEAAPATAAYAATLDRFLVPVTGDTLLAAAAFWRFADAAATCPGLERTCLQVAVLDHWDGLGLFPSADDSGCRVVVSVREGGYGRVTPQEAGEYVCP